MMRSLALSELAAASGGVLHGQDVAITSVSTDTRTLQSGDLFVALRGERFDAGEFTVEAGEKGASAAVVDTLVPDVEISQLQVDDTLRALADLAALQRQAFKGPLVALTGSVGKTTCKEMLASILNQAGPVLSTRGNLNNEIGVPLTLLSLEPQHRFAVVEMGAAKRGDIDYLAAFVRPDVALVTTVAESHLEGFGSIETIAETKAEIYQHIAEGGSAVVNIDNDYTSAMADKITGRRILRFSVEGDAQADTAAENIHQLGAASPCYGFELSIPEANSRIDIALQVPGRHMVSNAVAAASCAFAIGIDLASIQAGLQAYAGFGGRMQRFRGLGGCTLIDDSYNANPASVRAAIDVLADMPGPRLLALGGLAELGPDSRHLHAELGCYASEAGIDYLLASGGDSDASAESFSHQGHYFDTKQQLIAYCRQLLTDKTSPAPSTVLVKGSRSAAMEQVVHALLHEEELGEQALASDEENN